MRRAIVTARASQIEDAPARIQLLGDRRRPEPGQHIIEFPGGAIELSRLDDGSYWAHVIVNRRWAGRHMTNFQRAYGQVVASRVGRVGGGIEDLDRLEEVEQIAVLIRPSPPTEPPR